MITTNVIAIGGEPAVGKSTIVSAMQPDLGGHPFKHGLVNGTIYPVQDTQLFYYVGTYDGGDFEGTDRLAMNCHDDFKAFLATVPPNGVVVFEGDRLFNPSLFRMLSNVKIAIIKCSDEDKHLRHQMRGDDQGAQFLKAKKTKVEGIESAYNCYTYWNKEPDHIQIIASELMKLAEAEPSKEKQASLF